METYNYNDLKAAGIPEVFVQDISLLLKKEFSEDFIFRSIFRRTSWYV